MSLHIPVPQFISDTMDPTEHVDGKFYTSKSEFRKITKANGCIEVGNDPARLRPFQKPKVDELSIVDAIGQAAAMHGISE